jgi:membrane-bound ClpP family serine protease
MEILTLAYILIAVGLALVMAELLLPTHGILMALGCGVVIAGTALTFRGSTSTGVTTLLVVVVLLPTVVAFAFFVLPRTPMGRRLILKAPDDDDTIANNPVTLELEQLRGQCGRAMSALRPCGVVDFGGKRVDTVTDGAMIEPNQWVRCVDVKAGRVIVRPIDQPPDFNDMDSALFGEPKK